MYSLSNNSNSISPITQTEFSFETSAKVVKPLVINDTCFISKLEDPSFLSSHFPSPYMHYEDEALFFQDLHNLELQQQENSIVAGDKAKNLYQADPSKNSVLDDPKECNSIVEQIQRKKITKKDRHSKINTAHGPRDRRMRLSLDVARKFFDLQDLLGFDKASKTVEWLLTKSTSAIKELSFALGANSASSTSECEVISGVDESAIIENQQGQVKIKNVASCSKEKKKVKAPRRIPYHPLAKESREKARERARERTKEKRRLGEAKQHIGAWSCVDQNGEESGGTQDYYMKNPNPCNESHESSQLAVVAGENFVNDSMVVSGNWSPSAPFSFQLSAGMCTGPQYGDFQFYSKSSEAYNNMNL